MTSSTARTPPKFTLTDTTGLEQRVKYPQKWSSRVNRPRASVDSGDRGRGSWRRLVNDWNSPASPWGKAMITTINTEP